MAQEKTMTGYPSIDKPWLKYYSEEAINAKLPECTVYEYLYEQNKEFPEDIAIVYLGRKISYRELFVNIDLVADSFWSMGVREGDIVSICSVSTPEVIYSLYALSKIGATVNILEPRNNAERIEYYLNLTESKYLVMLDLCFPKIDSIVHNTKIKDVIVVSPFDSASGLVKAIGKVKRKQTKIEGKALYRDWKSFIACKEAHVKATYSEERPAVIVYTGGTTGVPKGVCLSDCALNTVVFEMKQTGDNISERRKKFLDIMPPFIAYGITCGIHMPLCLGMRNIVVPNFTPEKLDKLVWKHKPNLMMGVPSHYGLLCKSELLRKKRLPFLEVCGAGGDAFIPALEENVNDFLLEHGAPYKVAKGYGMTEMCSAVTVCFCEKNKLKSTGIPLCKNVVGVFTPGTDEEIPYNTQGEICFLTPTRMMGYLKNEEETKNVLIQHSDGKVWVHTKDIGYVDEDGFVFIINRMKRMIIRSDGHNVFPSVIEEVINTYEAVESCAVVGVTHVDRKNGQLTKAFITLKPEYKGKDERVIKELEQLLLQKLPERDTVEAYQIIEELPLTPIGKVDYRALEEM